jgi:uncharacterized protein (TIGR02996 family)
MNDETALLRAIITHPDEDTPRLAYADWIEEYGGDPNRAEFIRTQIGLEGGYDPATVTPLTPEREIELRQREAELFKGMFLPRELSERPGVRELTPEIAAIVAAKPHRITFRRGMISNLNLSRTRITELPLGLHVGGNLNIADTDIDALPLGLHVGGDLILSDNVPGLHAGGGLSLTGTPITELPSGLHVGGTLDLTDTEIDALPLGLHVGGTLDLQGIPIAQLPRDLHVGRYLNLSDTDITAEAAQRILTMPNLSREAKITGLETAGFDALAAQARRLPETNTGPGTPPRP